MFHFSFSANALSILGRVKQLFPSKVQQTALRLESAISGWQSYDDNDYPEPRCHQAPPHPLFWYTPCWASHHLCNTASSKLGTAPVPLHLCGEPQASNGGHELLQESLLPLVVLELVADEDEGLHQCTLLHLGQE